MAIRIQMRRDTAANWISVNPILAQGEFGYETDTGLLKMGDGLTPWNSLSYFATGSINGVVNVDGSITTSLSGDQVIIGVSDYISNSQVVSLTDGLQNQIDNIVQEGTSIESSGGSILVTQDGLNFNLEVASAPIANHNDLTGIQGGEVDEYFHLSEQQYNDYIGSTEVALISSGLQGQIDLIVEEGTTIESTDGTINVEQTLLNFDLTVNDYISSTEVASISSNLDSRLDIIEADYLVASDLTPYTLITTTQAVSSNLQGQITSNDGELELLFTEQKETREPTGFVNTNLDSGISVVEGTRTLTLTPNISGSVVYVKGARYDFTTAQQVVWSNLEGIHFFTIDLDGNLQSNHVSEFSGTDEILNHILRDNAFVAELYWDTTNNKALLFDERHGCTMDSATHYWLHQTQGTQYISGLGISVNAEENGNLDSHAQFSGALGRILDEDIFSNIATKALTGDNFVLYKEGSVGTWRWIKSSAPIVTTGTGRAAYNQVVGGTASLVEAGNNNFVLAHIFAAPILTDGISYFTIVGQAEYGNVSSAREGATVELSQLILDGLALPEFVPVATLIIQTSNVYSNTWKSRIRTTDTGEDYINWIGTDTFSSAGAVNTHNNLAGLQGGTVGEYFHLTAAEYSDLIGSSEVASISSGLDTRLDTIESDYLVSSDLTPYTLITTTQAVSSDLQGQIDGIIVPTIVGGNDIEVVEAPADTFTINYTGTGGISEAQADARFVNITGDTMTGNLIIDSSELQPLGYVGGNINIKYDSSIIVNNTSTSSQLLLFDQNDTGIIILDQVNKFSTNTPIRNGGIAIKIDESNYRDVFSYSYSSDITYVGDLNNRFTLISQDIRMVNIPTDTQENRKLLIIDSSSSGGSPTNRVYKSDLEIGDLITTSEVASISGDLQTQIDNFQGGLEWLAYSSNYTASANDGILADTSTGTFTVTLPATPSLGDTVGIIDSKGTFNTNNLVVTSSSLIQGSVDDLTLDINQASFELVYTGATLGWQLKTFLPAKVDSVNNSTGDLVSSLVETEVAITAATTLTSTAFGKFHVVSGASDYTVTLPAATGNSGKIIGVRITGTALFTIKGSGAELIDGENERVMWKDESAVLLCDGSGWTKVAGKSVPYVGRLKMSSTNNFINSARFLPNYASSYENILLNKASTVNKSIILPRTSQWKINVRVTINFTVGVHGFIFCSVYKNDILYSDITRIRQYGNTGTTAAGYIATFNLDDGCIKDDDIKIYIYQTSGANRDIIEVPDFLLDNIYEITEIPTW